MREDSPRRPERRFSSRVEMYARYRPRYPDALLDHLERGGRLRPASTVADVGSGTGMLTRALLERGHAVLAVEPNAEMRRLAERALGGFPGFRSLPGSAERTGLGAASVDGVTAAQAFHWFRLDEARLELARILRPGGFAALIWNRRREDGAFLAAYERLLQECGTDYGVVDHRKVAVPGTLSRFFGPGGYESARFPNRQDLDWEGLRGRALSSSYVPLAGDPGHDELMRRLRETFEAHARHGTVTIEYDTELFCGAIT